MQAEANLDEQHLNVITDAKDEVCRLLPTLNEEPIILEDKKDNSPATSQNIATYNATYFAEEEESNEFTSSCLEEIPRLDRNVGALTELATGSLATCTSILEVGKDDPLKQRHPNSAAASKIRLYFVTDRCPKAVIEAKRSARVPNGAEIITECQNSIQKDHQKLPSFSKLVSQDSKSSSSKSSSVDSSKLISCKSLAAPEEKSDFCKVYSQEYRLGASKDGSKSPKSSAPRKSVIELKSKSLDPPPSSHLEGDLIHDEAFLAASSITFHRHPPPISSSMKRRESETAVFSTAENSWMRRISDSTHSDKMHNLNTSSSTSKDSPFDSSSSNVQNFNKPQTPKIIEARALSRYHSSSMTKDDSNIECMKSNSIESPAIPCRCASTSSPFDPTGWAMEKMSKARRSKPLSWIQHDQSNRTVRKGLRERDPSFSPKQYQKEHKTWKGKMVQTLKRYGSGATPSESTSSEEFLGALGVPLEHCVSSFANEFVPLIVETCTRIVEEKGLENIGVYRVPGNSGAVNALIEELNKDPDGLCLENEKWQDINLVSSLLKHFFRKLPDSLITDELYDAIITANHIENAERRMLKLKKLIHELPEHNFETLRFLAQHLNRVASREEINKMDAHNLAIVFGPTLVRPQEESMLVMVRDMTDQCKVIESIITHCDWYFSSWDEDVYVPVGEEEEDPTPITGMNMELLAKAERLDKRSSLSF